MPQLPAPVTLSGAQLPAVQVPEQQSPPVPQAWPSGRHIVAAQKPLAQSSEQQSVALAQAAPGRLQ